MDTVSKTGQRHLILGFSMVLPLQSKSDSSVEENQKVYNKI